MLEKLKQDDEYIKAIDSSEDFKSFIKYELNPDDHHYLFYVISEYLCKNEMVVKAQVIGYLMSHYREDFEYLVQFIEDGLKN